VTDSRIPLADAPLFREVGGEDAEYQGEANAHGERDGHPRDVDGGHEQDVGEVEDDATHERGAQPAGLGLGQIDGKRPAVRAPASEGERQEERQHIDSEGVVPVEELEAPFLAGELLGVGPGSPAEHRHDA